MRTVLISAALLVFVLPAIAQNPSVGPPRQNPARLHGNPAGARPPVDEPPSFAEVPADAPVATLEGVCETASTAVSQSCKTVITRAEMDRIVGALLANAPQASRQQVSVNYVRMLAASQLAEEYKLEDDPTVARELQDQTKIAQMQVLTKAFYRHLLSAAENPPMTEIQHYYDGHPEQFEQGEVWRLSVPKSTGVPNSRPVDRAILKAEAESLRTLAATGYDFDQLEQQVYKDLQITGAPPPTRIPVVRRSELAPDQAIVFDLQPGQMSQVIDSYTHLVILKLVSKQTAPLDSVQAEIKSNLRGLRLQQELQQASKGITAEFNLKYFGLSRPPALFAFPNGWPSSASLAMTPDTRNRALSRRRPAVNPSAGTLTPQSHP